MFSYLKSFITPEHKTDLSRVAKVFDSKGFSDIINNLHDHKAVIAGPILLECLDLAEVKVSNIDIYINIFNVNSLIDYFMDRGYSLFYIHDEIILSDSIVYDALNYSCITSICNCHSKYREEHCSNSKCIRGCIRLHICNGSPDDYINSIMSATHQRIKFDGKKIYDDYLDITTQKLSKCQIDDEETILDLELMKFRILDYDYYPEETMLTGPCDRLIIQSELTCTQYKFSEKNQLFIPIPILI